MNRLQTSRQALGDRWRQSVESFATTMQGWPWLDTMRTLSERFREDRLGLTASSLTFTTLIALIPLVTVMLAIFSAFPMFAGFQLALEKYLVQNLVPPTIAQPVLRAITLFSAKAGELGTAGFAVLLATALALVLTIDRTLNVLWRVRRPRRLAQRVLLYWAALTLGPLLVGVSLTFTTYLLTNTTRTARSLSSGAELALQGFELVMLALGVAAMYRYVPNTHVRWRHALAGGVFVALALQVAKRGLAWYLGKTGVYTTIYGAFAAVPVFLLWIYVMWVVVLLGAVVAAYAPSLSMRIVRRPNTPGHRFTLALAVLRRLQAVRGAAERGLTLEALAMDLRMDPLVVEPVVASLEEIDWVARIDEDGSPRWVLLIDVDQTPAAALVGQVLLAPTPGNAALWQHARLDHLQVRALL
jgi:membrane protein